jgi:hypothetical protein
LALFVEIQRLIAAFRRAFYLDALQVDGIGRLRTRCLDLIRQRGLRVGSAQMQGNRQRQQSARVMQSPQLFHFGSRHVSRPGRCHGQGAEP